MQLDTSNMPILGLLEFGGEWSKLTTISFPAFSGLFAILIAAAVAAPDDIPTWNRWPRIKSGTKKI